MIVDVRLDKIYGYPDCLVEVETVKADLTQYRESPERLDAFFKGYSLLLFGFCPDVERVYYYVTVQLEINRPIRPHFTPPTCRGTCP